MNSGLQQDLFFFLFSFIFFFLKISSLKSYVSDIFIRRIHGICEVIGLAVLLKIELVPNFISRLQVAIYVVLVEHELWTYQATLITWLLASNEFVQVLETLDQKVMSMPSLKQLGLVFNNVQPRPYWFSSQHSSFRVAPNFFFHSSLIYCKFQLLRFMYAHLEVWMPGIMNINHYW